MDDVALLRRTVRRAAAAVVASTSLLAFAASRAARFPAALLFVGAAVYLAASLVYTPPSQIEAPTAGGSATGDGDG